MASTSFSAMMAGWLVVMMALVGPIASQEDYQAASQGDTAAAPLPPQIDVQPQFGAFGGNHEAFLASFHAQQLLADQNLNQGGFPVQDIPHQFPAHGTGRSASSFGDQELVTKVFIKPDGGIMTIQVPQQVNFR